MRFLLLAALSAGLATAGTFAYNDFSNVTGLTINGDASQNSPFLQLVPSAESKAGTAYATTPIALDASTGFSTAFEFYVTTDRGNPTDGFTFLLQNEGVTAVGAGGQGSGYVGITPSVAVLFRGRGPSFIGAVTDGIDPLPGYPTLPPGATTFDEGVFYNQDEFAWIDYDPLTTILSVYLSTSSTEPSIPVMTTTVDLFGTVGSQAFVGFSAGTGAGYGTNDILNWTFTSQDDLPGVPEPATAGFFALGLAALGLLGRRTFKRR
jgi:hypothetical protein